MKKEFQREALAWAAGGLSKALVDAAANALAEDLDSPSLRILAGATAATVDDQADNWAPRAFEELELKVCERHSSEAIVEFARLRAWEFLRSRGSYCEESPRQLTAEFMATTLPLASTLS